MISLTNNKDLKPEDFPSDIKGLRMTKQRREVLAVILRDRDHPTANDVFLRAQDRMPTISLATVYNCLEALVNHTIVRQVNLDRESSRYCPNLNDHSPCQDEASGPVPLHFLSFLTPFKSARLILTLCTTVDTVVASSVAWIS